MGRHRLHAAPRPGGKRRVALRGGLLGASVAVVLGTAAVTTGFVPVGSSFPYVGVKTAGSDAKTSEAGTKASPSPGSALEQQGGLANLSGRAPSGVSTPSSPAPSAPSSPSASPSPSPSPSTEPAKTPVASPTPTPVKPKPSAPKTSAPAAPPAPPASAGHSAEEAAVLTLVNQERAQAGCGPVRANPPLAALAGAFSKDMAVRGFFDHTDPDGNTPWDRATKAGISGMGGENIARGQGDAAAVMKAWMNSPGHKANILNCEFRTLGVGVYNAAGGPWWTQDFGF
ncbi:MULTISPECIES: CAP domain-containing protein [unclassified Streptomyces]|uniref:CAP domain-containing protein n=1 Tax=unclassified Streptomyces TaxID=2593676 RepID=UPI00203084CB|nr:MULTISPECIES: CAP domain-containing protein [unclassified Streptomyces]MCM1970205.1 CAP domain-containing protein [Streptomyces sp. G1]MCX5122236.1 CAP domain-containing protein [Streptomyces sp. NBC_00347]MCX5295582.1 CAP domain-containing protein [Streptomyces sp. NBC_00193]